MFCRASEERTNFIQRRKKKTGKERTVVKNKRMRRKIRTVVRKRENGEGRRKNERANYVNRNIEASSFNN
jgi:hypothetical protein